jgi:hypothetical protein
VTLEDAIEETVNGLLVADVHRNGLGGRARFGLDRRDRVGERLLSPATADHGRSEPGEFERRRSPEAGAGAGYDADPVLE